MPASVNLNRSEPRESPATPFPMPERRSTDRQTQLYSGGRREEGKEDQKPPRLERDGFVVKSAKRLRALTCPSSRFRASWTGFSPFRRLLTHALSVSEASPASPQPSSLCHPSRGPDP